MATRPSSPLKRALKAAKGAMGPQRYGVNGKHIKCSICNCDRFKVGDHIDLFMCHVLVCADCGHIESFTKKPSQI